MSRVACIIRTCLAVVFVLSVTAVGGGQRLNAPDPAQMEEAPDLGYRPVKHGLAIPADMELGPPSSVAWTTNDTLLLLNRGPNPLMEFDENGEFVRSWGQGEYVRPHGLRIDPDGNIWTADDRGHRVTKMNPGGDVLMTIGTKGEAVDGLLNEPTDVAVNAAGEIFVVVGHGSGEPRVIKFDSSGTLMTSWGGQGTGPGQFDTPHSIVVDQDGLVYVADRQNRRVQIFTAGGAFVEERPYRGLPCGLHIDADQQMYMVSGHAGQILKLDHDGVAVGANGQPGPGLGEFGEAHYMTKAPNGDIWVADPSATKLHRFVTK